LLVHKEKLIGWALLPIIIGGAIFGASLINSSAQESDWINFSCPIKPGGLVVYGYSKNLNAASVDGDLVRDAEFQNHQLIFDAQLQDGILYHHIMNLDDKTLRVQTNNRRKTLPLIKCRLIAGEELQSKSKHKRQRG
jgi:hypothetical protein